MSRQRLTKAVIRFLENRSYKYLKFLGGGGFADIIAVLDPTGKEVAVKIVQFQDVWPVEDQYWPKLRHPHILEVYGVIRVKELKVKLYLMPVLPRALDEVVQSKEFRRDPKSYERVKKWLFQTILALEYLHSNGLAHLDIKSDNILINNEDNAVLADFSGLNFTKDPVERLISPNVYHSPECFIHDAKKNIRGECFDVWTYGLMVLNVMTGHYFQKKVTPLEGCFMNWSTHLCPILEKSLKESKFEKLVKKSFPRAFLSSSDVNLARHFIEFILNANPENRTSALRLKHHLLIKTVSNLFIKESLHMMAQEINPFKNAQSEQDRNSCGDVSSNMKKLKCSAAPSHDKGTSRRKNVKNWFVKQFNRIF